MNRERRLLIGAIAGQAVAGLFIWTVGAFVAWDIHWLANIGSWSGVERIFLLIFSTVAIVPSTIIGLIVGDEWR